MNCPKCLKPCTKSKDNFWRCQRRSTSGRCNFKLSIKKGTWFSQSKLSLKKIILFTNMWLTLSSPRQKVIVDELEISPVTFVDWSSFCRGVCMEWATQHSEKLGGPGKIVEINEAKLGKRKYNRGKRVEGQWIFGAIERDSRKSFYIPADKRDAATLVIIIKEWILPGTTIISDCWKAYARLNNEGFTHLTVNHSLNFVDPETGVHDQNIERSWRDLRSSVPKYGKRKQHYDGYLAEYQFKRAYQRNETRLHHFLKIAGQMYKNTPSAAEQPAGEPVAGPSGNPANQPGPANNENFSDSD